MHTIVGNISEADIFTDGLNGALSAWYIGENLVKAIHRVNIRMVELY